MTSTEHSRKSPNASPTWFPFFRHPATATTCSSGHRRIRRRYPTSSSCSVVGESSGTTRGISASRIASISKVSSMHSRKLRPAHFPSYRSIASPMLLALGIAPENERPPLVAIAALPLRSRQCFATSIRDVTGRRGWASEWASTTKRRGQTLERICSSDGQLEPFGPMVSRTIMPDPGTSPSDGVLLRSGRTMSASPSERSLLWRG